jgi:signal transduction histidine kinase
MSDIVWAINPRRDSLRDLVQRMRQFATDVLTARDIEFDFIAPDAAQDSKLETDVRREVLLIFKESLNNLVRHSRCSRAEIHFLVESGSLILQVQDNGCGFDETAESRGHGLFSMRQRADNLGAELNIESQQGHGTTVKLKVSVRNPRRAFGRYKQEI